MRAAPRCTHSSQALPTFRLHAASNSPCPPHIHIPPPSPHPLAHPHPPTRPPTHPTPGPQMNTPGEQDGLIATAINGTTSVFYDQLVWRTTANETTNTVFFSTFFGGVSRQGTGGVPRGGGGAYSLEWVKPCGGHRGWRAGVG